MTTKGCEKMTAMRRAACAFIATLVLIAMAACEDAPAAEPIVIATASPGGPYLTYGQGLARILSRELGQEVTAQSTQGPAQNILLLERKQATLAFITMGVGLQAWNGSDWAKGTQYRSMRVIFPMYDTAFQFVAAKRLHLHWLEDLTGLHIGAGPRAGTAGVYLPMIFRALDIKADVRFGAWESLTSQLKSGDLGGIVFGTGLPTPALTQLIALEPVDFVPPSADQIALIRKALPEISRSTVPAQTYPTQERDYPTIGLYNFAVVHKDLPDDFVYRIVKAVFDSREELVKAQSSAKETVPANIGRDTVLPLHPGAERYYREIVVPIPVEQTH
jgi:TRAP transporter TAXI family solute receptor